MIMFSTEQSYVKPAALTFSVLETEIWDNANRGMMGFMNASRQFTGIMLAQNGSLSLWSNGAEVSGSAVAYGGTFVPFGAGATTNTLTYTINTVTGAISSLSFSGSSADYSSLIAAATPFTDEATRYLVLGGGRYDNLALTAVPEPSTWALLFGGFGMFLGFRRLRNRMG